jgi:hypothetical protein
MPVTWKCSDPSCGNDVDRMIFGTTYCKVHCDKAVSEREKSLERVREKLG